MDSSSKGTTRASSSPSAPLPATSTTDIAAASNRESEISNAETPEDLDVFVKELMDSMQSRFNNLSDTILGRIDDMGSKIDELEKSINDLMDQAGIDSPPSSENTTTNRAANNSGAAASSSLKRSGNANKSDREF